MIIEKTSVSVGEFFATHLYRIDAEKSPCDLDFAFKVVGALVEKFLAIFSPHPDPTCMTCHEPFGLGWVTTTVDNGEGTSILEGADLVITLMLVLIYLQRHQPEPHRVNLEGRVCIRRFGSTRMNPALAGCQPALEALFDSRDFDFEDAPQAALDIAALFFEIEDRFPAGIEPETLPYFTDWLLHCVTLDHTRAVTTDGARILEMARLGKVAVAYLNRCRT